MRKNPIVDIICSDCGETFQDEKHWWGTAEICNSCVEKRDLRDRCPRHGGKEGKNCNLCELEAKF